MSISKCLITGGAGFIGSNLAEYWLSRGVEVILYDNLCRCGSTRNLEWLKSNYGKRVEFIRGDVRQRDSALLDAVERVEAVIHLAAQVAVTTSVTDPRADFEVNAGGTLNVLEAVRQSSNRPPVIYSSTNKVYGKMDDVLVEQDGERYRYRGGLAGVAESRSLDFYSPYGCSKGAGDQYVRDYARIYGLRTVVFRQSCIYGPRQFGVEDQGWVAWFAMRAIGGLPVTIFGDGRQVRDVLFIGDLLDAYAAALDRIDSVSGEVFNIGGGPSNTLSLLELIHFLSLQGGGNVSHIFDEWRPGDQLVYISNINKAHELLGWSPKVNVENGLTRLVEWLTSNAHLFLERAGMRA